MEPAASPALPEGFHAATASAAIKRPGREDMALLRCPDGAALAAMYTTNLVCAAPVQVSRANLRASGGRCGALLINSGCANAATGGDGLRDAQSLVRATAEACGIRMEEVQHDSTGVIGARLPVERMIDRIGPMAAAASPGSAEPFARAIMTTDTHPKMAECMVEHEGRRCTVVGVAKGAGMIHPNMATMIAVLMTDAALAPPDLDAHLRAAVERSFHRISIDGDTSTNDAVFALASGRRGAFPADRLRQAFVDVARSLAMQVVRDGEGSERSLHVRVTGARTPEDALAVARTVAGSLLVRCAVTGGDPNWGRILAAAGRAGVPFDVDRVALRVGGAPLFERGAPAPTPRAAREAAFRGRTVEIALDLACGEACDEFITCGLTTEYVRLNADYTT
jgi:glutamate N-acetyltransferase/amino-acid N-acetyltransferase